MTRGLLSLLFLISFVRVSSGQSPSPSAAPILPQGQVLILDHQTTLTFPPEEVLYFIDFGEGEGKRLRGTLQRKGGESSLLSGTWRSAVRIVLPEQQFVVHYGILYIGRDRKFFLEPKVSREIPKVTSVTQGTDAVREELLQKKELLRSWELQVKTQEETLQRLREDAGVIGNLGKIIEVKDELERTQKTTAMVNQEIEALKEFLRLAKVKSTPKNYIGREGQLTRQLAELAKAAKTAEAQEFSRKSKSTGELQRKLALIEATRNENIGDLQKSLIKIRSQREKLERDAKLQYSKQ